MFMGSLLQVLVAMSRRLIITKGILMHFLWD